MDTFYAVIVFTLILKYCVAYQNYLVNKIVLKKHCKNNKSYFLFVEMNYCQPNPCKNGGQCHNIPDEPFYICTCTVGFIGKHCDRKFLT